MPCPAWGRGQVRVPPGTGGPSLPNRWEQACGYGFWLGSERWACRGRWVGAWSPVCPLSSSTASEQNGHQLLPADFSGSSFLELKGLHTFERDLGSVGQKGGRGSSSLASIQTPSPEGSPVTPGRRWRWMWCSWPGAPAACSSTMGRRRTAGETSCRWHCGTATWSSVTTWARGQQSSGVHASVGCAASWALGWVPGWGHAGGPAAGLMLLCPPGARSQWPWAPGPGSHWSGMAARVPCALATGPVCWGSPR